MMSAKLRGAKLHPGPLKLRRARGGRDCLEWVREDPKNDPYCFFDVKSNKAPPLPPKSAGPGPLFLPAVRARSASPRGKRSKSPETSSKPKASAAKEEHDLSKRPTWNESHHVTYGVINEHISSGAREYFDKPKSMDFRCIPTFERYAMNDRQCTWFDQAAPLGEARRTIFDNIGPYHLGGSKQQQMPSWWRRVQDWGCYSTPDLQDPLQSPLAKHFKGENTFLAALAKMPPEQAREYWRGWAEAKEAQSDALRKKLKAEDLRRQKWSQHENEGKGEPKPEPPRQKKKRDPAGNWNPSWASTASLGNAEVGPCQREYFSVLDPRHGRSTDNMSLSLSLTSKSPFLAT